MDGPDAESSFGQQEEARLAPESKISERQEQPRSVNKTATPLTTADIFKGVWVIEDDPATESVSDTGSEVLATCK